MSALFELVTTLLAQAPAEGPPALQPPVRMGTIEGGWEYVWFSFGITWATLAAYGLSLWVRRPQQSSKELS